MSGVDFRKCNLRGAKLDNAQLAGADFTGVNCEYADSLGRERPNHRGSEVRRGTKLHAATIRKAKGCSFRKAKLNETWADGASAFFEECDFREANLKQLHSHMTRYTDCDFRGADLSDADIKITTFRGATSVKPTCPASTCSRGRSRTRSSWGRTSNSPTCEKPPSKADFRNANLRDAVLSGADLTGALVAGADLAGAVLTGEGGRS